MSEVDPDNLGNCYIYWPAVMAFSDQVAACDVGLRRASHRAFRVKKKFAIEMQRYNRMIVVWSMDGRTTREFLMNTLRMARFPQTGISGAASLQFRHRKYWLAVKETGG